jgi:hypothetical protein
LGGGENQMIYMPTRMRERRDVMRVKSWYLSVVGVGCRQYKLWIEVVYEKCRVLSYAM